MIDKFLVCECHSLDHLVVVSYDQEENRVYLQVHLAQSKGFWNRLWRAIKYVFNRSCRYGDWDEVILDPGKVSELEALLKRVKQPSTTS